MSSSIRIFAALLSTSVFAGCISDADDFTTSNFAAAVAVGTSSAEIANSTLTQRQTGSDLNSDGDGYAYETGVENGEGFFARRTNSRH
jgi:outer membrane murein-binding lipoprotein Lpp